MCASVIECMCKICIRRKIRVLHSLGALAVANIIAHNLHILYIVYAAEYTVTPVRDQLASSSVIGILLTQNFHFLNLVCNTYCIAYCTTDQWFLKCTAPNWKVFCLCHIKFHWIIRCERYSISLSLYLLFLKQISANLPNVGFISYSVHALWCEHSTFT